MATITIAPEHVDELRAAALSLYSVKAETLHLATNGYLGDRGSLAPLLHHRAEFREVEALVDQTGASNLSRRRSSSAARRTCSQSFCRARASFRGMRETYSPWTCVAVYRIAAGTFALALRRGLITRSPVDGLAPAERPKQRNKTRVAVLDAKTLGRLVSAGTSERWSAALALAAFAGLRLGEIRALRWADIDLKVGTLTVRRSMLPDGTPKAPKTEAGTRTLPILPALRRVLIVWKLKVPHTRPGDLVIGTAERGAVQERNLRRALDDAKTAAGLDGLDDRLSWHSLRHSFASMLATDLELPATTLARLTGHADAGFTMKVYAKDRRDDSVVVEDVSSAWQEPA